MGIKGLLQSLRGHESRVHVSELKGQIVAIDILVW
jgi:hypothetical protein